MAWKERLVTYKVSYLTLPGPQAGTFIPCEYSHTYFIAGWSWLCVGGFHFLALLFVSVPEVKAQLWFSFYGASWRFLLVHFGCPPAVWEEPAPDLSPVFYWVICLFTSICSLKSSLKLRTLALCPVTHYFVAVVWCLTGSYFWLKKNALHLLIFSFTVSGLYGFWVLCHV